MNKKIALTALMLLTWLSFAFNQSELPVTPNATKEAKELLAFLYQISGKNILSAQHNYSRHMTKDSKRAKELSGNSPAIWGCDFGFREIENRDKVVQEAIKQNQNGSIITLMWHTVRPVDNEPGEWMENVQSDLTDQEWNELITPGSPLNLRWQKQVDTVAYYLKVLRDKHIPVLWRPYHEMNGMWFWWGDKKGENGFKKLWIMMYERYTKVHHLNNLIWVWSPNSPRDTPNDEAYDYAYYFPGTEYVDVLATDVYHNDYKQCHYDNLLKLAKGKPIAMGEVGEMPTPAILDQQPKWCYFMVWAGFLDSSNTPEKVSALYHDKRTINLETLKDYRK
jgi:mannan endo-1,4-beta-mannosidase